VSQLNDYKSYEGSILITFLSLLIFFTPCRKKLIKSLYRSGNPSVKGRFENSSIEIPTHPSSLFLKE